MQSIKLLGDRYIAFFGLYTNSIEQECYDYTLTEAW